MFAIQVCGILKIKIGKLSPWNGAEEWRAVPTWGLREIKLVVPMRHGFEFGFLVVFLSQRKRCKITVTPYSYSYRSADWMRERWAVSRHRYGRSSGGSPPCSWQRGRCAWWPGAASRWRRNRGRNEDGRDHRSFRRRKQGEGYFAMRFDLARDMTVAWEGYLTGEATCTGGRRVEDERKREGYFGLFFNSAKNCRIPIFARKDQIERN